MPPTSSCLALRSLLLLLLLALFYALAASRVKDQQLVSQRDVERAGVAAARAVKAAATAAKPSSSLLVDLDALDASFAAAKVNCPPVPQAIADSFSLTAEDTRDLCWHSNLAKAVLEDVEGERNLEEEEEKRFSSRGVPAGVDCEEKDWCDSSSRCTRVCARGSVRVPAWLSHALDTQEALSTRLPLCFAALPGAHNAAVTLADGYGALDPAFRAFFSWVRWVQPDAPLRTNDQVLSLSDQLNLGIRAVELDVHFVAGKLRIAHCGGFHAPPLDRFVAALNAVAKLLRRSFKWDVETFGCSPSLSSIPAGEQREFEDAVAEVGAWMKRRLSKRGQLPENNGTTSSSSLPPPPPLLVLYLDDQPDLLQWGKVSELLSAIEGNLPPGSIYSPRDHEEWQKAKKTSSSSTSISSSLSSSSYLWPSALELSAMNKSIIVVSGTDYGEAMSSLVFPRKGENAPCGWAEPALAGFRGAPLCDAECSARDGCDDGGGEGQDRRARTLQGRILRVLSCELQYGPLNCDLTWKQDNDPVLDEVNIPLVTSCGLNMPSPDTVSPLRAAAGVWTWAEGHPPLVPGSDPDSPPDSPPPPEPSPPPPPPRPPEKRGSWPRRLLSWIRDHILFSRHRGGKQGGGGGATALLRFPWPPRPRPRPSPPPPPAPVPPRRRRALCGALTASDGRWRARNCTDALPTACRNRHVVVGVERGSRGDSEQLLWLLPPADALPPQRGECGRSRGSEGGEEKLSSSSSLPPPSGFLWEAPRTPIENVALASRLRELDFEAAWLPVSEPDWELAFPEL